METETRVDDLVDRWEDMRDHGMPLSIEELCASCPELVGEVRHRVEALQAMDSALDTEKLESRSMAGHCDPTRAGPDHRVPEVLRATAVYRPRRHHDHGGLGVVYTAHQEELDRLVALKRIRPDKLRASARCRFLREAALTARLQHPGIVPIYGLGQDDGGPFYTMPFIRGQNLQGAIDTFHSDDSLRRDPGRRSLGFRGLLQQFIAACNTVAYAHDQGVVHRDLKPSNIMLGPYGETLVMDWGLAKRFGDGAANDDAGDAPSPGPSSEDVTVTGEILGTPHYMSPEQAKGETVGPASDVFSLGLILYAILTGKSAFETSGLRAPDRLEAGREAAIVPPRSRDPRLSLRPGGDLLEGAGVARRRPLSLGSKPGGRRDAMAGRRARDGLARARLDPGTAMGVAAPHGGDGGGGGACGRSDRAGGRGRRAGAGQRSA